MSESDSNSEMQSGKNIYTNATNIPSLLSGITDSGVISNKRRGKQFRQRRDTQHERKAHSTILQTRILSGKNKI
ncbi:hypothetical protein QQG55_17580 [Brugia pahangi]|uniref:Uncharacterized protein n=1 Tax=Brugia pahangi TaxID=6280 RepID=A0A0N4TGQ1_BRUPA|nr:unnamed protein product [Brugia pahangi]VDN88537.1 unnamed protein product [Brugia pahangi]